MFICSPEAREINRFALGPFFYRLFLLCTRMYPVTTFLSYFELNARYMLYLLSIWTFPERCEVSVKYKNGAVAVRLQICL